jgi:glutathione synthase
MRFAFVLDPLDRLDPTGDTSLAIIEAADQLGHASYVTEARELSIVAGRAHAPLRRVRLADAPMDGVRWVAPRDWYTLDPAEPAETGTQPLDTFDAVFVRTDPPVDSRYLWATWLLDAIDPTRTLLVNDPRGIRDANEKLFGLRFPALVPPTLVSSDVDALRRFVADHGRAVAKPIDGHAGRGVLQLCAGDPNLRSIIELGTARGCQPLLVQAWVDEAACGNRRILLWEGEILGVVNRPVEPDDFRTGSPAELVRPTRAERRIVAALAPELQARGLRFVGLDTIGDRLIEVNVTSPGGVRQAMGLGAPEMARDLVRSVEASVATQQRRSQAPIDSAPRPSSAQRTGNGPGKE